MRRRAEPVLVIHGVAVRNKSEFVKCVRDLNEAVGRREWSFRAAYWGDLGVAEPDVDGIMPRSRLFDRFAEEAVGAQRWRSDFARQAFTFLGDVVQYQRPSCRKQIQNRIRAAVPEGYGTRKNPISVIAHSLGALIAFDMAMQRANQHRYRLWIKAFVTLGAQVSLSSRGNLLQEGVRDALEISDEGCWILRPK
jgi:pimeloyl-ACP methyl ester carboxylesterase